MPDPRRLRRGAFADELLGAASLCECLPRPPQVAERLRRPRQRAREAPLGVPAMQVDDLGGRQERARASVQELGEQRLEAMTGSRRAITNDEPGSFERGYKLARGASR